MFEHVIVGIDGTDGGLDAVALAGRLGARRMTLVGAYRVDGVPPDVLLARYDQILREDTLAGLAAARAAAGRDAALLAIGDAPDRALQRVADDAGADLICIGSSRHGRLGRILPGDVARGVLQGAPCPVAIAPRGYAGHARPISRIAVGYTGSPESEAALDVAAACTAGRRARLVVESAYEVPRRLLGTDPGEALAAHQHRTAHDAVGRALDRVPGATGDVTRGAAVEVLLDVARHSDLLVVGSRGWGPLRRAGLGSTSARLVDQAPCPLIVVPRPPQSEAQGSAHGQAA
jgi:nucleotide-binding universal stress UspA family protein